MKQLFSLAGERAEASAGERVPNPMPEPDESGSALRPNRATRDRTQDKERNLVLVCVWHGCEKAFTSKQAMQRHHSSVHLGVKHVCPAAGCAEEFARKSSMEQHHRSVHLGVKHVCPAAGCAEEFMSKPAMQRHHRSVHLGVARQSRRISVTLGSLLVSLKGTCPLSVPGPWRIDCVLIGGCIVEGWVGASILVVGGGQAEVHAARWWRSGAEGRQPRKSC